MKVVITGSSKGIGQLTALMFLTSGYEVHGIDIQESSIEHENYHHHVADVANRDALPYIRDVDILINNAGTWSADVDNIDVNLRGTINCTKEYGLKPSIKAIVNIASASAHSGAEFPEYVASKGGMVAYTKWTALEVAKYGATCNSISPGGVETGSNSHILRNPDLRSQVMKETILNRWADPQEIAEWIYFVAVINKSMTAQDILIDNGEMAKANFVW